MINTLLNYMYTVLSLYATNSRTSDQDVNTVYRAHHYFLLSHFQFGLFIIMLCDILHLGYIVFEGVSNALI